MSCDRKLTVKLILVGSSGVGKTSLVAAFLRQEFEGQAVSTVSPAFCTAPVAVDARTTVELQLWDTAGQEQYQSISQMFYREAHVAFVCYDGPEAASVEKWVARVREHAPQARLYLVATKADLLAGRAEEDAAAGDGERLAARFRARHFLTSALAGRNVAELFETAAREAAGADCVVRPREGEPRPRNPPPEDQCC